MKEISKELLARLWKAANEHSVVMGGEWLDDSYEGQEPPERPEMDSALITEVINYLESTI